MKTFYMMNNIGKAKYVVCYHDGVKKHPDGSKFYDICIFRNKRKLAQFLNNLASNGYVEGKPSIYQ